MSLKRYQELQGKLQRIRVKDNNRMTEEAKRVLKEMEEIYFEDLSEKEQNSVNSD